MTLNLPRAVEAETLEGDYSLETAILRAHKTVEETLEIVQDVAPPEVEEAPSFELDMPVPGQRRSNRMVAQELQAQAETLTRRADEVKAAAEKTLGLAITSRVATTAQKIEEFYGVRQVPEGLLFVAHFPNAKNVAIAGDFNNWTPARMTEDRQSGKSESEDTFRALVALKPGRYRYRLVVDGRWQADPHNVHAEANPFGELDSVVEVV